MIALFALGEVVLECAQQDFNYGVNALLFRELLDIPEVSYSFHISSISSLTDTIFVAR